MHRKANIKINPKCSNRVFNLLTFKRTALNQGKKVDNKEKKVDLDQMLTSSSMIIKF